ncbi:MAG: glycosyltransferase family 1 protein [Dysgonamonadaceae bacterium]|jgi:hypothetical protein|nr:glycosyltransferase family 1 protein [Dysgonamonadaceae bacterium]
MNNDSIKFKQVLKIRTYRKKVDARYLDLVWEWEDEFKNLLGISFNYITKIDDYLDKIIKRTGINFSSLFSPNCYEFMWEMKARLKNHVYNRHNLIPNIVDFHVSKDELEDFYRAYSKNPFILISNLEVLPFLQENSFPKKIYHFPLSLADRYRISPTTQFEKKYDLVLVGRQNPVLEEYMKLYSEKNKDFVYVYRVLKGEASSNGSQKDMSFDYYTSKGEFLGNINNRNGYMELLRKSKIGFYSTPGIDGGEVRTKGFNYVTPRFLELLACGCHVIARYKDTLDTDFYKLNEFCQSVNTYYDFEKQMDKALKTPVDMKKYSDYLENHYTSKRIELLKNIFEKEKIKINITNC